MVSLLDLDDDISSTIFTLLNVYALRAMAGTSRTGFQLASRALVRTVKLSRNPEQVVAFCEFCLKHHLCPHIIDFTLSQSAVYSQPPIDPTKGYQRDADTAESALFASALADVLDAAVNLAHLAFRNCTAVLIESEPRIPSIICRRPPTLSLMLSGADAHSFQQVSSVSGLTHLKLHTLHILNSDINATEEVLDSVLANSILSLETLSLGHAIPASLRLEGSPPRAWERVYHFSMAGVSISPKSRTHHQCRGQSSLFQWPKTTCIKLIATPQALEDFIHEMGHLSLYQRPQSVTRYYRFDSITEPLVFHGGMPPPPGNVTDPVASPPPLVTLFKTLSQWASHLTYLSLDMGYSSQEVLQCLEYLKNSAPLLVSLSHLKYVKLSVMTWLRTVPGPWYVPVPVFMKPEELLRAWVEGVPSLQYLELNVLYDEWGHTWWRIESQGNHPATSRQVSKEEGLSAKSWFDLEEWK
ncbi:hypothetical protein GALMADRAFT_135253 [Galerina marginata CBS 339.88]|uniref:F-box domain-containing protein n=1 Tax=Galerina marginata (strain CBS 339.88) TaxID=685588 RepID=A0A067TSC0_GALM3|nr:hypothetical protein GALMADRAFT_135253 [Galerina marginata CBS 339.88]